MIQTEVGVLILILIMLMCLGSYVFLVSRKKETDLALVLAQIYFLIFLRRLGMKMQALFGKFLNLLNKIQNSNSMIARGLLYGKNIGIALCLFLLVFLVLKMAVLMPSFLLKILDKILERVIGAGLFCGFMIIPTIGIMCYVFVAPSFLVDNNRRRVAAMAAFVTGQFLRFTSVYNRPLYERLVQPHPMKKMFFFFLAFFLVQLLWTSRTTWRNRRFLYPIYQRKLVGLFVFLGTRLLFLQFEFMMTFWMQILPHPYIPPDSMILPLINSYLNNKANKLLFVRSSFAGWLIGHVFFLILYLNLFKHFVAWARTCYSNQIRWDDEY
jgi:hypothetical protein